MAIVGREKCYENIILFTRLLTKSDVWGYGYDYKVSIQMSNNQHKCKQTIK